MERVILHLVPSIFISFITQILLHELGHFMGGLLTGWKLLFIQIYNLVFKVSNKRIRMITVKSKNFQCIMYPKSIYNKALLYTMGGYIINILTGGIGLIIIIMVPMSPVLWLYMWSFSAFGIGLFFMNGIASLRRICNDRACYNFLKKDKHTLNCHNAQLMISRHLFRGLTYHQIGEESICLCPNTVKNDIEAYQAILEYYYFLDIEDYNKALVSLDKINETDNISRDITNIIKMERIYIKLLTYINNFGNEYYDLNWSSLENCVKSCYKKGDIHSYRIKIVLEVCIELKTGNETQSIEILEKSIKTIKNENYVYEGELKFCIQQIKKIKNIIELKKKNCMYIDRKNIQKM